MREEHAKATTSEGLEAIARATWRRARALGDSTAAPVSPSSAPSPDPPATVPVEGDARYSDARRSIDALALASDRRAQFLEEIATAEKDGSAYRLASIVEQANRVAERAEETRPFDAARAAIKALGLPPKKYAQYARQAEAAVAAGKDYQPVVARARKAAEKLAPKRAGTTTAPTPASQSDLDVALETFNAEPGWRAALQRRRPNGYVLVVYPEARGPEDAVASVDVIGYDLDEIRWLSDRVPTSQQDSITERLDRALWSAFDAENPSSETDKDEERAESPSPIQGLIELMERRSKTLGSPSQRSGSGVEGFEQIAGALKDLAEPSGISADELERWLESEELLEAAEAVGKLRAGDATPVRDVMQGIWGRVLVELPVVRVEGRPGELRVPPTAIFGPAGGKFVLERVREGDRRSLRRIRVSERQGGGQKGPPATWVKAFSRLADTYMKEAPEEAGGANGSDIARSLWESWTTDRIVPEFDELEEAFENTRAPADFRELALDLVGDVSDEINVDDATDRLKPGSEVHEAERSEAFFIELYEKLGSFHDDLVRAPRTLQDVRVLLYWTAAMLAAPLCQGDVKRRATAAFEQAKALYDKARQRLLEGQSVEAVRRLHAAMRRIGAAAAEIARSCGEGQIDIGVTPPHLPVRPEDKADVLGGTVEVRP